MKNNYVMASDIKAIYDRFIDLRHKYLDAVLLVEKEFRPLFQKLVDDVLKIEGVSSSWYLFKQGRLLYDMTQISKVNDITVFQELKDIDLWRREEIKKACSLDLEDL